MPADEAAVKYFSASSLPPRSIARTPFLHKAKADVLSAGAQGDEQSTAHARTTRPGKQHVRTSAVPYRIEKLGGPFFLK